MKKIAFIISTLLLTGCAKDPQPSSQYNILDPFQVATDYLLNSRHYRSEQGTLEFNFRKYLLLQKTNTASVFRTDDWEQIFIKLNNTPDEDEITRRFKLDDNLNQTCWGNQSDAQISVQSNGLRSTVKANYLNACVSSNLGHNYPLFVYTWTEDPVIGQYLTIIKPAKHYNNSNYLCKLKREGYSFDMHLYCK